MPLPPPLAIGLLSVEGERLDITLTSESLLTIDAEIEFRYHSGVISIEWVQALTLPGISSVIESTSLPSSVIDHLADTPHDAYLSAVIRMPEALGSAGIAVPTVYLAGQPVRAVETIQDDGVVTIASTATLVETDDLVVLAAGGTNDQ